MLDKKLKILTLNVSDSSGGAARAAYRIHNAVMDAGVEGKFLVKNKYLADTSVIAVDSFDKKYPLSNIIRYVQHKIKNKIQQTQWRPYAEREDVFMSDLRSSSIHGALQKIDFDVLHLHWINLRFLDINELTKIHKPIVWTLHDCWPFTGVCHYFYECERYKQSCGCCPHLASKQEKDLSHKAWRKKIEIFSKLNIHVVCPSNWLAQAARESSIFKQFPISVIPNPLDTDFFRPGSNIEACRELNISSDKKYILYGAMNAIKDRNKGFEELKASLHYYEKQFDTKDIELLIFGSNEKAEIVLHHIPSINLGMLNDHQLRAAYRVSSVMVTPSLSENLSNIIMESLSCGTPVVAFDIGGNSDMIDHKLNGYLAKAIDTEDIAYGIDYCLTNNALSVTARTKVEHDFNTDKVSKQYLELYCSLAK